MIADIITNTASFSLPALLTIVLTFGFAPGFCMRLIALMYPRTDPRRQELYAEMKAVPRIERPLWVAEQLETGLFEGISSRRRAARERKPEEHWGAPTEAAKAEIQTENVGILAGTVHNSRVVVICPEEHERFLRLMESTDTFGAGLRFNDYYVQGGREATWHPEKPTEEP